MPDGEGVGPSGGVVAFVAAVVVMAGVVGFAAPAATGDPTADVLVRVCLVAAVGAGAVLLLAPGSRAIAPSARAWLVAVLAGGFLAAGAAVVLSGSAFPPLGVALDQGFRVASITKFAHGVQLVDFAYKDLPAFYPPLFFWVLGRASAWFGIAPYEALKVGAILTAFAVPVVGLASWARVTRDWMLALAVAVAVLAFQDWYEPYAWLAVVVFVPWWLSFVLQIGPRRPARPATIIGGAAIGAALLCTYYYFFFIGALHLVLLLAFRRAAARRGVALAPRSIRQSAVVLGGVAAISAVYWLPLAVAIATTPGARSLQNRYFDPSYVGLPLRFLDFDLLGWLMLFGLTYLAVAAFRSEVAAALAGLLVAAYLWFLLGYLAFLADEPLLTAKTTLLIDVVLLAAAGLGAVEGARAIHRSVVLRERIGERGLSAAVAIGAVVVTLAVASDAIAAIPYLEEQRAATAPTALLDTFEQATRGRYADTVVLTDQEQLPEYLPVYVFNVWSAHYANPASEFDRRSRFLDRLSRERDPDVFAAALAHNRYDRVASVALPRAGDELPYTFSDDAFPRGVSRRTITFRVSQFDDRWFSSRGSPTLGVFVRRARDPLRALDADQRRQLHRRFPGDLDDRARR